MREVGECYVFDDDRVWHMLTPVAVLEGNQFAYRDTLAFDMLPRGLGAREMNLHESVLCKNNDWPAVELTCASRRMQQIVSTAGSSQPQLHPNFCVSA